MSRPPNSPERGRTPFQVAPWIELLAAGLGGLQGALFAAGERHRRIDVLDVLDVIVIHAVAAGTGAGTLVLLAELGTPTPVAGLVCVVVTTCVRLADAPLGRTTRAGIHECPKAFKAT